MSVDQVGFGHVLIDTRRVTISSHEITKMLWIQSSAMSRLASILSINDSNKTNHLQRKKPQSEMKIDVCLTGSYYGLPYLERSPSIMSISNNM